VNSEPVNADNTTAQLDRFEIRIAGFGGQGVVTIGRILGIAFTVHDLKNSVNTQSYGPESRGGACKSEIVVSDGDINYPYVRKADVFVCLSQTAYDTYIHDLKEDGILLFDPNSVQSDKIGDKDKTFEIPAMELSRQIGSVKFQNTVALGALYLLVKEKLSEDALRKAIAENVPQETLKDNMEAFDIGLEHMKAHYATK
jgi:2-oxoglutarate ferredoxin oxidoreductase subunit gamma